MRGGVSQKDPDLLVLNTTSRAAVLAGYPCRVTALLQEAGFIKDQHPVRVPQLLHDVDTQRSTYCVRVPLGAIEEALHALWSTFVHSLSQLPAILALGHAQQAEQ